MNVERTLHIFSNHRPAKREANLVSQLTESIDKLLSHQSQSVLKLRLGLIGERELTLEKVAELIGGFTGERAREIEVNAFRKIIEADQLLGDTFRQRISEFFASYGDLIFTEDLSKFDPWFAGFSLKASGWKVFLKYFSPDLGVLKINDVVVIMKASKVDFFKSLVVQLQFHRRQGRKDIQFFETLKSDPEVDFPITDYFVSALSEIAEDYAPTISSMVMRYVESTTGEVHMEGFLSFALENGLKVEKKKQQTAENIFIKNCICVSRNPTRYATVDTIGVNALRIQKFCNGFYKYWLANFTVERAFHGEEVRDWGEAHGFSEEIRESNWRATALLLLDNIGRFKSNKLKVWLSASWGEEQPHSIDELIENTLKEAGRPMKVKELAKALYPVRGVGPNFQVHERKGILRCGRNSWKYRWED